MRRRRREPPAPSDTPAAPTKSCAACERNTDPIGAQDQDVRVLAFGGGGYDAVMQLGVIHALVVADAQPPDLVVGLSVGAVNAAALAEVLKADGGIRRDYQNPLLWREARMGRFREFLYEVQQTPSRLRDMLLPDMYEADAGMALAPHRLATHHEKERLERQDAMRTRSGLVRFLNAIGRLRLTVATLTKYARCLLGVRAASSQTRSRGWWPWLTGWMQRVQEASRAFRTFLGHVPSSVQALLFITRASLWGGSTWHTQRRGYPTGDIIFRFTWRMGSALLFATSILVVLLLRQFHWRPLESISEFLANPLLRLLTEALALLVILAVAFYVSRTIAYLMISGAVMFLALLPIRRLRYALLYGVRDRFLEHYGLLRDLGGYYFVRDVLIRLFDQTYFGVKRLDAVAQFAAGAHSAEAEEHSLAATKPRTFRAYTADDPKIHVVPVAADLASGALTPLPETTTIVDGLLAATAQPPMVRPIKLGNTYYINGTRIASEPTTAIRELLRDRVHPEATSVHLYAVSSLPVEANQVTPLREKRYNGLMDVLMRVQQLQRFRNAKLDRAITALYDGALPPQREKVEMNPDGKLRALKCFANGEHMVRTIVVPIEPSEHAITLSEDLFRARTQKEQQVAIAETVAAGCRLTLETIIAADISAAGTGVVPCAAVIAKRRGDTIQGLPGASEICSRCTFAIDTTQHDKSLREHGDSTARWPIDMLLAPRATIPTPGSTATPPPDISAPTNVVKPPTVNLLFSGGVFRGVFLVGVLNALHLFRIRPQLVAGSSVGSITAAMAARIFTLPDTKRLLGINRMASTYLTLDQHVVTDRFADFVRRLGLRAAQANVSLADIDDALRSYDRPTGARWARALRRLASGVEHLLYVSPFELLSLVHSLRRRDARRAYRLLRQYFQALLDRGGVGLEVLGTEPLSYLIREHVLSEEQREQRTVPLDVFGEQAVSLLVTATNLSAGKLDIIGARDNTDARRAATLVDALLASSAFPGVFRPRWGWEVFVGENVEDQLVDGGVMDNLPLDAVVGYLSREVSARRAAVRPVDHADEPVPHLIFTASLERDPQRPKPGGLARVAQRWPATRQHARELRYNRKIDTFATAQREFRKIYDRYAQAAVELPRVPLDIEVVVVKPRWLCGTFAFHPMLGFTRDRQAASIAHGCASTLRQVAELDQTAEAPRWLTEWLFDPAVRNSLDRERLADLTPARKKDGTCHFRTDGACPFSRQASSPGLHESVRQDLHVIYKLCGKNVTHEGTP